MVHGWEKWIYSIFVCIIGICLISTSAGADYDLTLTDLSMRVTINNLETLPLGDIPPETIVGSVSILNKGSEVSPLFNIAFSLVSYLNEGRTVNLISRPGETINPGSSGRVYLAHPRPEGVTPGKYYLKASLVIGGLVEDSLISSDFVSLGGGERIPSSIPVYRGYKITKPGYYILQQHIAARDTSAVFEITCDDVTLDGNGFSISGPAGARGETTGVLVSTGMNKPLRRTTIKDLDISGFTNGIWLFDISDAKVLNTRISQANRFGIRLDRIRSSTFSDNIIENCLTGIGVFRSYGNTFTNNMLKNQNNAIVNENMINNWSIDPIPGRNILGGEERGGNVWLTPDGRGFSLNATDSNNDGFADMSFAIDADNIDYHPLVYHPVFIEDVNPDDSEASSTPIAEDIESVREEDEQLQDTDVELYETSIEVIPDDTEDTNLNDEVEASNIPMVEEIEPVREEDEQLQDTDVETYEGSVQIIPNSQNTIDILITNVTGSQQICRGEEIQISATVKNNGSAEVKNLDLYYYISRESPIHPKSRVIGVASVSLRPNEEEVILASFKGLEEMEGYIEGRYYLGVIADPYGIFATLNRENNTYILNERLSINPCN